MSEVGKKKAARTEVATLGGGCFWCTEAVFNEIEGAIKVEPGYSGGATKKPSHEEVSTGTTGHAEVVQVTFDPVVVSYRDILDIFFSTHDPTTLDRQGPDVGHQYRSVIFYHGEAQKETADGLIRELGGSGKFKSPIVTKVEPFKEFFAAEDYHKDYFKRHPDQPYCRLVISPKIDKFRKLYRDRLKKE